MVLHSSADFCFHDLTNKKHSHECGDYSNSNKGWIWNGMFKKQILHECYHQSLKTFGHVVCVITFNRHDYITITVRPLRQLRPFSFILLMVMSFIDATLTSLHCKFSLTSLTSVCLDFLMSLIHLSPWIPGCVMFSSQSEQHCRDLRCLAKIQLFTVCLVFCCHPYSQTISSLKPAAVSFCIQIIFRYLLSIITDFDRFHMNLCKHVTHPKLFISICLIKMKYIVIYCPFYF